MCEKDKVPRVDVAPSKAFASFISHMSDPSTKKDRDKVRRNLFGTPDVALSVREFCREQFEALLEESSRQWNFDFVREKPLPSGRYLWEAAASPIKSPPPAEAKATTQSRENDAAARKRPKTEKENKICDEKPCLMQTPKKSKTSRFVQTRIKGLRRRRSSKRLRQKRRQRHRPKKTSRLGNYLFDGVKRT